jgi:MarR family transcriptional regulator, organic hydroperoxide resistance regulator
LIEAFKNSSSSKYRSRMKRTLGTQLRHLIELLDSALEIAYQDAGLDYKPRFTPVMRTLSKNSSMTINQLAVEAGITQPAATQTVKIMHDKGIVHIEKGNEDARKRIVSLSPHGQEILSKVLKCWDATAIATNKLEAELDMPLTVLVEQAISALETTSFSQRIAAANQIEQINNNEAKEI